MAYTDIQMFMGKLNQLINCNDIQFINNPFIIRERPQFQLLYDNLGSLIQTLFVDEHQDLHEVGKVNDLKKRFICAAEEAQYIVDLFLSGVHIRTNEHFPTLRDFNRSLDLDDVRRSFESVKVEFMSMRIDNMKMEYPPAQIPITRDSLGKKKIVDEVFVGLDRDVELIRNKLVEDQKKVDVVSIVGMGGIGKTTLATKVFNDGYVKYHFNVRVWVTVSQIYDKRDVLVQIMESIGGQLHLDKANESRLRELVHKSLIGKRYLIVIDDIWHIEAWDNLRLFFPHDNTRSRILLTSRLTEVAKHANSDGLIHHLGYLNKGKGWELLCQKVFHGNECPEWSIKPGMNIVENCKGLPLAVVVIAGVLAKEAWNEKFWLEIAKRTSSYIVGEENGCLETLGLSYNHLPLHLRECFLYLGGFPEDYEFEVQRLTWLWVAEGFIKEDGSRSLEDVAEGYLMDLIDRNLVTVEDRWRSNGAIETCKVHDLVRELCQVKAKEERFILQTSKEHIDDSFLLTLSSHFPNATTPPCKPVRMFISNDINILGISYPSTGNLRSILSFSSFISLSDDIAKSFRSFVLLRVLDLLKCSLNKFPRSMKLLVHLRYLAFKKESTTFPSSICNLWNLQTLIYNTRYHYGDCVKLPSNISNLVNLRHLWSNSFFVLPSIEKPMNLQTISDVGLGEGAGRFQNCFPYIKELTCTAFLDKENDFKSLTSLKKLNLTAGPKGHETICGKNYITFPATLKSLTLYYCYLPWSDMSIIQSLPNLQVLQLKHGAFEGSYWDTREHEFRHLKFLRLEWLNIKMWEAYSTSFPCLKQLEIMWCKDLEEIPLEIGDIPTLELIKIRKCRDSVGESVRRIQEEQHDLGNYHLKIHIFE